MTERNGDCVAVARNDWNNKRHCEGACDRGNLRMQYGIASLLLAMTGATGIALLLLAMNDGK